MKTLEIPSEAREDADHIFKGMYDMPLKDAPRTILDIGAHVGLFSVWARERWPDAEISAFEPSPENAKRFTSNTAGLDIRFRNAGVRGFVGQATLFNNRNSLCRSFHYKDGESQTVLCEDAAILPSAEFVKIDTEGSELEILERLDLSQTQAIALEAHNWEDMGRITALLVARGFCVHDKWLTTNGCWIMKFARREALAIKQRLMIAIPYYGNTPPAFTECLLRLIQNPPCNLTLHHVAGDSLVSRARNTLTAEFLESDCDELLFIDSDLVFSPEQIARLLSHDVDVVGGFYPKKQDGDVNWVCNGLLTPTEPDANGLQEVRYMGTGFLKIRRRVFEQMIVRWGEEIRYNPDSAGWRTEYDLWRVGVYPYPDGSRRYLSEDWYFCQRWIDLGGKVYGDTRIILKHIGQAVYPLRHQAMQLLASPTSSNSPDSPL